jgi:hypothetical protein
MIERVMQAFEAWIAAKASLAQHDGEYPLWGHYIHGSGPKREKLEEDVARARQAYMRAMDEWFEWKRLHGPQDPGR